jgi:hypothetical protein
MGTVTSTLSALDGKPLVIGSQATVQVSSTDTDGTVSKIKIYLDNVLADSTSMGNYTWTIADTTKFHTIKVIAFDDDGAQSVDSVNYALYGSRWFKVSDTFPWEDFRIIFLEANNVLFAIEPVYSNIYMSNDGVKWTEGNLNCAPNGYTSFNNRVWLTNLSTQTSTDDGIDWTSSLLIKPNYDYFNCRSFTFFDNLYGIIDYEIFEDKVGKKGLFIFRNDSLVENGDLDSLYIDIYLSEFVKINNELFLYNCNGSKTGVHSNDLIGWVKEENILPFDTAVSNSNFRTTNLIGFDNKIYGMTRLGEFWTSIDGRNWVKDEILLNPVTHELFKYNNEIWLFQVNENEVWKQELFYLKKYFE